MVRKELRHREGNNTYLRDTKARDRRTVKSSDEVG